MKIFTIKGTVPTVPKKKSNRFILASRRNGKVKVMHPATIRALNALNS